MPTTLDMVDVPRGVIFLYFLVFSKLFYLFIDALVLITEFLGSKTTLSLLILMFIVYLVFIIFTNIIFRIFGSVFCLMISAFLILPRWPTGYGRLTQI